MDLSDDEAGVNNNNTNTPSLRFHSLNTNPNWFKDTVDIQKIENVSIVKDLNQ